MIMPTACLQKWKILSSCAIICSSFFFSCTGLNLYHSGYGFEGNTNPTPEYTTTAPLFKGGAVLHSHTIPGALGKAKEGELRRGEACAWSSLWLFAGGDASIQAAKQDGGIDYIHFIEYKQEATFIFFQHSFCTIIVGTKANIHSNIKEENSRIPNKPHDNKETEDNSKK